MSTIICLSQQQTVPEFDRPRPDRLLAGNPLRTTWQHDQAAAGRISSGIWACEPGRWRIEFADDKHEFFCVITGRVRLHDGSGQISEIGPGEAAIIPTGFSGAFEVVEPVRKYYLVIQGV